MCLINHDDVNLLILRISSKFHSATNKKWVFKSETEWLKIGTSSIHTKQTSDSSRAGTIRSAANTIHIRYRLCQYDTYSIRYACFKINNFGFQQQSECFGLIFTVQQTNTSAKAK